MKEDLSIKPRPTMCATCPYRPGSKYAHLQDKLTMSAMSEASRICHSTGPANAVNANPKQPARICRGSRDIQLKLMTAFRIIDEPTDAAWDRAWEAMKKERGIKSKRPRQK